MFPYIRCVALALLFATAPAFSAPPEAFDAWTPSGWKRVATATGDLNRDGLEDAVLVLEETNPANFKQNDSLGAPVLNLNPRRLVVLFNTPKGYQKVLSRDRLLPSENDAEAPCLVDPLLEQGGISISGGRLVIELGTWVSCGSYGVTHSKYTFRLENNRFRLIGYDYSEFSRSTGEASGRSINYLTGKIKITTGQNEFSDSTPKVAWKRVSGQREFFLDDMSFDCDSGDTPVCAWD